MVVPRNACFLLLVFYRSRDFSGHPCGDVDRESVEAATANVATRSIRTDCVLVALDLFGFPSWRHGISKPAGQRFFWKTWDSLYIGIGLGWHCSFGLACSGAVAGPTVATFPGGTPGHSRRCPQSHDRRHSGHEPERSYAPDRAGILFPDSLRVGR